MTTKLSTVIFSCLALASSAFAQQIQSFDLVWSGDTPFLKSIAKQSIDTEALGNDLYGRPYVSKASATGQITIDTSKLQSGSGVIPPEAIISFKMVVSGAPTGSGYFYTEDVQSYSIDLGGSLDLTKELVGQTLPSGVSWAGLEDINTVVPSGDCVLDAVAGSLAPVSTEFPFVIRTGGADNSADNRYCYLQLVSFKPSEQAAPEAAAPAPESAPESPDAPSAATN